MKSVSKELDLTTPKYITQAQGLHKLLKNMSDKDLQKYMKISRNLLGKVRQDIDHWSPNGTTATMFAFSGDIYSGLQAETLSNEEILYAQENLRILSGLYGILKPLDSISNYRLEMGYTLPDIEKDVAHYWKPQLAHELMNEDWVLDLSAKEYTKAILGPVSKERVSAPKFLTVHPKTHKARQVIVHTKIARGVFARWAIRNKIGDPFQLKEFNEVGYSYDPSQSTRHCPVFLAQDFNGNGLSVRQTKNMRS